MQIDRKQLIEEEKLRNYIRKAIKKINEGKESKILDDESKLRSVISKLMEADSNVAAPHRSTGINVLEDLLKKIIPQIEIEYKKLTTTPDQRASFRSHIVNAIQNSLAPVKVSDKAGSEEEAEQAIDIGLEEQTKLGQVKNLANDVESLAVGETIIIERADDHPDKFFIKHNEDGTYSMSHDLYTKPIQSDHHQNMSLEAMSEWITGLEESSPFRRLYTGVVNEENIKKIIEVEDIEVEVGDELEQDLEVPGPEDEEDFIDIDGAEEIPDEEGEDFKIDGKDETGRNVAFRAFERIEQAVVDSYNILSDDDDRNLFYDYLITNIKLYFDKFEDEILTALPEPTTPEYEQEKDSQLDSGEEDLGL